MTVTLREYDFPDRRLLTVDAVAGHLVWQPPEVSVILGVSNKLEEALHLDHILSDQIPVYQRPSGGEAVVLSPRMLVIAGVLFPVELPGVKKNFHLFNDRIIRALKSLGVRDLRHSGISDIAIGDRKILGSALYHSRRRLFYHAVLNVSESTEVISRYLRHPQREPDYRRGRNHSTFVTSLAAEGYRSTNIDIKLALDREFTISAIVLKMNTGQKTPAELIAV
ncbi:MAG: hypothetical protein ABIA75_13990 [Candidatus Neomarinimicrobiota bacterium]